MAERLGGADVRSKVFCSPPVYGKSLQSNTGQSQLAFSDPASMAVIYKSAEPISRQGGRNFYVDVGYITPPKPAYAKSKRTNEE